MSMLLPHILVNCRPFFGFARRQRLIGEVFPWPSERIITAWLVNSRQLRCQMTMWSRLDDGPYRKEEPPVTRLLYKWSGQCVAYPTTGILMRFLQLLSSHPSFFMLSLVLLGKPLHVDYEPVRHDLLVERNSLHWTHLIGIIIINNNPPQSSGFFPIISFFLHSTTCSDFD